MRESHSSVIEISDVKLETFKGKPYSSIFLKTSHNTSALLRFLYQNQVELTKALALDLYAFADQFLQSELMHQCESFLVKNVRLDNLMALIDFVEKFGADSLKNSILEFMMKNLQEIKQNQNYYPIPPSDIWEIASQFQQIPQKVRGSK